MTPIGQPCTCEPMTRRYSLFVQSVFVFVRQTLAMGVGLVFEADLSTSEHSSHWVLQGVALCLNIDQ
jgi:dynein heavy chain